MFGSTTCLACGQSYKAKAGACPRCLVPVGATSLLPVAQGGPPQLLRLYTGNHALKDFQQEAQLLQKVGWLVFSQQAGGENSLKIGQRGPTQVSAVYHRS